MISGKNGLPQKGKETELRRHNSGNANRIPKCEKPSTIRPEKPEPALPRSRSKERALLQGIPKHRPHRDFHDSVSLQTQSQAHRGVRPLGAPGLESGGRGHRAGAWHVPPSRLQPRCRLGGFPGNGGSGVPRRGEKRLTSPSPRLGVGGPNVPPPLSRY